MIGFTVIGHGDAYLGVRLTEVNNLASNGLTTHTHTLHCNGETHNVGQVLHFRLIQLGFNMTKAREQWIEAVLLVRLFQYSTVTNTHEALVDGFLKHELLRDTEAAQAVVAIAAAIVPRLLAPNIAWDGGVEQDRFVELNPYANAAATILMRCYGERCGKAVLDAR